MTDTTLDAERRSSLQGILKPPPFCNDSTTASSAHGSANMFDFSPTQDFGFKGDIFIAETGSIPTGTGASSFTGFKVAPLSGAAAR
jgi:hypothetical protein